MFFYRKVGILCKDSASECNESLLSNCRVQPILCKDSASECNESLLSNCRVQPILCKDSDYKPNLQTYSHKKVFYSQFRCFFKHNNAGFQTRLLLIANKTCFDCKQGFFSLQTRLVWKSKRAKNAKEQKYIEIQVVTTRSQNLPQSDADSECHVAENHL